MSRIELLDGAMGSELIKRGANLPEHIWSASINTDNPDAVHAIHKDYIEAGSNYITTNTFRTTPRAYMKTGLNINVATKLAKNSLLEAINASKRASNGKTKVLGSIAPLEDCYKPNLFPGIDSAKKEYNQLANWLNVKEIDIFLIETMNSIIEAKVCIEEFSLYNKPIWVSFILKDQKHILSGETLTDAIKMVQKYNINALLINCSSMYATNYCMKTISDSWNKRWGIYPNFGIGAPSPNGDIKIIHSNDNFLRMCYNATDLGATLLGSCCGSSPKHIKLLSRFL